MHRWRVLKLARIGICFCRYRMDPGQGGGSVGSMGSGGKSFYGGVAPTANGSGVGGGAYGGGRRGPAGSVVRSAGGSGTTQRGPVAVDARRSPDGLGPQTNGAVEAGVAEWADVAGKANFGTM